MSISLEPNEFFTYKGEIFRLLELYVVKEHRTKNLIKPRTVASVKSIKTGEEKEFYLDQLEEVTE